MSLKSFRDKITGKRKRWLRNQTIRSQIFAALVLITVATATILAITLYASSRRTIEDQYQEAHEESLQVASNILEINMQSIVNEERNLLNNKTFMTAMSREREGQTSFPSSVNRRVIEQMQEVLFSRTELRDAAAISSSGNIAFTSQNDYNQSYMVSWYNGTQNILSQDWIAACDKANGKEVFFSTNVLFQNGKDDVFSVGKKLINPRTRAAEGYVVFNVRKSSLSSAFGSSTEAYDTSDYLILNQGNRLVYSTRELSDQEREEVVAAVTGTDMKKAKEVVASWYQNPLTGWRVVNIISRDELAEKSNYIAIIAVIVVLALIGASVGLSSLIARRITVPLNKLEKTMRNVAGGNYRVSEKFDDSEAGRIGNQFKDLVNNNIDLQNRLLNSQIRERESELLLLQSQINPHYLYNTLDTLYFMAVIRGEDQIADFVQALSENFRLSLNKGDKLIPVSKELERIRAYMKIQNYRFEGKYLLEISVEDSMLDEYMLTFLLQPLVENSVYHGLEPKPGKGTIWLTGRKQNDVMTFTVEDDGVGITDWKAVGQGYGVRNIQERIHLFYGEEYGVSFGERDGGGTKVSVRIPCLPEEKAREILSGLPEDRVWSPVDAKR